MSWPHPIRAWRARRNQRRLEAVRHEQAQRSIDRGDWPLVWVHGQRPAGRAGQRCRKTGRRTGAAGIAEVLFMDGRSFVVDERGLVTARQLEADLEAERAAYAAR